MGGRARVFSPEEEDHRDVMTYAVGQFVFAVGICAVCAALEFWVISHASALLDAESMVASFRRMLRGVSDGEVLLTENMSICESTECLKHLLMSPTGCKGQNLGSPEWHPFYLFFVFWLWLPF